MAGKGTSRAHLRSPRRVPEVCGPCSGDGPDSDRAVTPPLRQLTWQASPACTGLAGDRCTAARPIAPSAECQLCAHTRPARRPRFGWSKLELSPKSACQVEAGAEAKADRDVWDLRPGDAQNCKIGSSTWSHTDDSGEDRHLFQCSVAVQPNEAHRWEAAMGLGRAPLHGDQRRAPSV